MMRCMEQRFFMAFRYQQLCRLLLRLSVLHHLLQPILNNCKIWVGYCNIRLNFLTVNYFYLIEGMPHELIVSHHSIHC